MATSKPTLQQRLVAALDYYGCKSTGMAAASGVSQSVIHRIVKDGQGSVNSKTLDKLEPFLALTASKDLFVGGRRKNRDDNERVNNASEFSLA